MKQKNFRYCSYDKCGDRRVHWERPFTPRGPQKIMVPDDYTGTRQYCSFECAIYDGAYSVQKGWIEK